MSTWNKSGDKRSFCHLLSRNQKVTAWAWNTGSSVLDESVGFYVALMGWARDD